MAGSFLPARVQRARALIAAALGWSALCLPVALAPLAAAEGGEPLDKRIERIENGLLPASLDGAPPLPPWNIAGPADAPTGAAVPLLLRIGEAASNPVTIVITPVAGT